MKRLILSLLLVACSGSSGAEILSTSTPSPEPTTSVSFAPEEDSGAASRTAPSPSSEQDSGSSAQDAASPDASDSGSPADAGQDSGADAGQDSGPVVVEPKRYGVTFDGSVGQRVISPLPADMTGQQVVTLEGWFKHDLVNGGHALLFQSPGFYAAVATSGAHNGELAACLPDATVCTYTGVQFGVNVWRHVAVVLDHGAMCVYQDGTDYGCVATGVTQFPQVSSTVGLDTTTRLAFGAGSMGSLSSTTSVDEFRVSYTRRYMGAYAVPKHLTSDAEAKLTLMLDEGAGPSTPPAALYGGASWVEVAR